MDMVNQILSDIIVRGKLLYLRVQVLVLLCLVQVFPLIHKAVFQVQRLGRLKKPIHIKIPHYLIG